MSFCQGKIDLGEISANKIDGKVIAFSKRNFAALSHVVRVLLPNLILLLQSRPSFITGTFGFSLD